MLKKIPIFLVTILIGLLTATAANSQTTSIKPDENSASSSPTTVTADSQDDCPKLLNKTLDAYQAAKDHIAQLEKEIVERQKLSEIQDAQNGALKTAIDNLKTIISEQQKLIEILSKNQRKKLKFCLGVCF